MNRTLQATIGAVLILVIAFSAVSICQTLGKRWKVDITDQKIFTLSDGTKAILAKLNQPITAKLYYARTAAMKATDQIQYFNNYYEFVRALLEEYVSVSKGMVKLEVIDPRPYSNEEEEALQQGLRKFPITQEESFFFGLVVQTPFGVEKSIAFFSPDRQNFVEYDISYLIDTAITRQKKKIGVMSPLPVMGDDSSDYMAQMMRMQGQQPTPAWTIVEQLRRQYEVDRVPTEVNDANDFNNVDVLLVVHPKGLSEKTLFAIDQYVVRGGRAVVCIDPHCFADKPNPQTRMMGPAEQSSDLQPLLRTWGLDMPANTFAGDRALAIAASVTRNQRVEKIIGYLDLTAGCFNPKNVISGQLNDVRVLFAGALQEVNDPKPVAQDSNSPDRKVEAASPKLSHTPLVMTTSRGNTWKVANPYELAYPDPTALMQKFTDGTRPVTMGYLVTGRFKSSYPGGIAIEVDQKDPNDPNSTKKVKKPITGLAEGTMDGAIVVFSDVDFMTNEMAYQSSFFGSLVVGDNSALLMNAIDDLGGSSDLISIRSRGNFRRPFDRVDQIEREAEEKTAEEVAKLNAEITGYNQELQKLTSSVQEGQQEIIGNALVQKRRDIELKVRTAQRQLNEVKLKRREKIEQLGDTLRQANMLAAPMVILVVAVVLGLRRSVRKRHYISHASDS